MMVKEVELLLTHFSLVLRDTIAYQHCSCEILQLFKFSLVVTD